MVRLMAKAAIVTLLFTVSGMQLPESVTYHDGQLYVSNIASHPWQHDDNGYISLLNTDGDIVQKKWRTRTSDGPMSAPKGMDILKERLYVADIDRVHWFSLQDNQSGTIPVPGAQKLNDVVAHNDTVYVSDTGTGELVHIDAKTHNVTKTSGVPGLNGLTFDDEGMWALSTTGHEVYRLDPTGQTPPEALGVSDKLTSADGIEAIQIGERKYLVVSDFAAGKVLLIAVERRQVRTLLETKTPADIGVDREHNTLFVPSMRGNAVEAYQWGVELKSEE